MNDAPPAIGRYELLGRIASGGMATVYLGRAVGARGFSRLVAIKKLHPSLEQAPDIVAMFFEEARLAARIRHPNVVPVLDVDEGDGLCIVMEYVEGDQLLGLLRSAAESGARIPVPIAMRIALDLLAGLHEAHELRGDDDQPLRIVHRDVSPHNVLVGVDGITKLTDFGIARADSRATITQEGELKGKIAYMAPEQASGQRIDRRADVFASGIVLWELFSAQRLFRAETSVATLSQVLVAPIAALSSLGLPLSISRAVEKALERDAEARWQTAADLAEALEIAATDAGGIASARQVAEHVRRVSGDKIANERARLKREVSEPREAPVPTAEATTADTDRTSRRSRRSRRPVIAALVAAFAAVTVTYAWSRSNTAAPTITPAPSVSWLANASPVDLDAAPLTTVTTAPVAPAPIAATAEPLSPPSTPTRAHPRSAPRKGDSIAPNPYNRH